MKTSRISTYEWDLSEIENYLRDEQGYSPDATFEWQYQYEGQSSGRYVVTGLIVTEKD